MTDDNPEPTELAGVAEDVADLLVEFGDNVYPRETLDEASIRRRWHEVYGR